MSEKTCLVCGKKNPKYCCPGCEKRTCSLLCVKSHKKQFQCSGVTCKTKFLSQRDYTDTALLSDYRFLEDVDRLAYKATHDGRCKRRRWNSKVQQLCRKAKQSGVNLRLMPVGMSRRRENSSIFDTEKKCLMWRIRWVFPQASVEYVDKRVSELAVVSDSLKKYIDPEEADPVYKQRLKGYCRIGPQNVFVFLKMEPQSANKLKYCQLDSSHTLKQCLAQKMVVEFPTLHVVLPEKAFSYVSHHQDMSCSHVLEGKDVDNSRMETFSHVAEVQDDENKDEESSISLHQTYNSLIINTAVQQ